MQKEITLHPKQFEAISFETQYCAAIAGVRGGKTFLGSYWAASQLTKHKGHGIIAAPTYKILQQATMPTFFEQFPHYQAYYKEQKSIIEFPTGQKIFVRSMESPLSAEGITADWAWLDEAGQMPLLAWTVIRSRTSLTKGQVLITTTPYNMGWLYHDFYLPWKNKQDEDLTVVTWASVDNPYFPKDFADKEKVRLRPEEYARRYLGEFTRMEGLVYSLHNWHVIKPELVRAEITLGGVDWGWSNPGALTVVKYSDGRFFIVDEWYETEKTTPQIIEAAMALQKKWGVNRWYADSANPEKIREANTNTGLYVIPYDKERDAITAGVSLIQNLLLENRLFVFNNLSNTLAEFESYHYPEKRDDKPIKDMPEPIDNHLMDALRYAVHGFQPVTRPSVPKMIYLNPIDRLLGNRQKEEMGTSYD